MSKKSRARMWVSILTGEGLLVTLRERWQWTPRRLLRRASKAPMGEPPALRDYAGALHIHSTYSDGTGTVSEIAAAAAKAGLDFIVLHDHSNLDAITHGEEGRHHGVLTLIGTELTTDQGHLLAFRVPPALVPASNNAAEAQRAIQESGGFGSIALPCDLKDHWKDFSQRRNGIGLEVFNLSAIARGKISVIGFLLALLRYRGSRPQRAFHLIASRPTRELKLWDELNQATLAGASPVVGIGSLDAHAVMKIARRKFPIPSYEQLFRTLRTHIVIDQPLSLRDEDVAKDKRMVLEALERGHCFVAYDNFGDSKGFAFYGVRGQEGAIMGDNVELGALSKEDALWLHAKAPSRRSIIQLRRNGVVSAIGRKGELSVEIRQAGVYRVEAYLYRGRIGSLHWGVKPWVFSNPIYVREKA